MEGKIEINGQIGSFDGEKGVELVDIIAQVRKQPDATSFRVYINSPGGYVDVGFDIYNYIRSLGLPITTIGNGLVASIATVIFMAGDKRVVRKGNLFMIHLPMGGAQYATADEMENVSKELRKIENKVIDFYSEKFNIGKEAIQPLLREETWLTDQQLKELGITTMDAIEVSAVAKFDTKTTKENPMAKTKNKNEKSALAKIMAIINGEEDAVAKIVLTADTKELNFPDVGEDDPISEGDRATLEGEQPPAEVLLQDGRTVVFENGIVSEILEREEEENSDDEDQVEAIRQELAEMTADRDKIKGEKEKLQEKYKKAQAKVVKQEAIIEKIKNLETEEDPDEEEEKRDGKSKSQQKTKGKSRFQKAVAGMK